MTTTRPEREVRADFDRETIVVYQAYGPEIAGPALREGRFVAPFSFQRMTWIKPSFLWLMERSNWAQKAGQEHVLAVRITRAGWDAALAQGVLTAFEPRVHTTHDAWRRQFDAARVHVQWDPERSMSGAALPHRAIQVGLSRHVIRTFVDEWVRELRDVTPLVRKLRASRTASDLPRERPYPVDAATARRLGM